MKWHGRNIGGVCMYGGSWCSESLALTINSNEAFGTKSVLCV